MKNKNAMPSGAAIQAVFAAFAVGDFPLVLSLAKAMRSTYPRFVLGWKAEGAAWQSLGKPENALPLMREAVRLQPSDGEGLSNLGYCLWQCEKSEEAVPVLQKALHHEPAAFVAWSNLAGALNKLKRYAEGENAAQKALDISPRYAMAWNNLGFSQKHQHQNEGAEKSFREAILCDPMMVDAYSNLGMVLNEMRVDGAKEAYRQALFLNPNYAEAYMNLGIFHKDHDNAVDAEVCYRQALALKPDYGDAWTNLGVLLEEKNDFSASEAAYQKALALKPSHALVYYNLGKLYLTMGRLEDSLAAYRRSLEIEEKRVGAMSGLLFLLRSMTDVEEENYGQIARRYGACVREEVKAPFLHLAQKNRFSLKVGFVSADFKTHPVAYFLEAVLQAITQNHPEIQCLAYVNSAVLDATSERLQQIFSRWQRIDRFSDEDAARRIHADEIDILIDLSGHTAGGRLPIFARKPAPLQLAWLGYFATTGLSEIDYILVDKVGVPDNHREQFTEKVWVLPDTRLCFTAPQDAPAVSALPMQSAGYLTLGCFQRVSKVNDHLLSIWQRIFTALPSARLYWQHHEMKDAALLEKTQKRLNAASIVPERFELSKGEVRAAYFGTYSKVDVILDTFPYPGGTTTCEALWMGVPTITLAGNTMLARQGASLLTAAGLSDWVTDTPDAYIEKAVALAKEPEKLAMLRANLRDNVKKSPLFDAETFANNFISALKAMWAEKQGKLVHDDKTS